jgi:hypothetical protein
MIFLENIKVAGAYLILISIHGNIAEDIKFLITDLD